MSFPSKPNRFISSFPILLPSFFISLALRLARDVFLVASSASLKGSENFLRPGIDLEMSDRAPNVLTPKFWETLFEIFSTPSNSLTNLFVDFI